MTVADSGPEATHYAGNLLTYAVPSAAGGVKTVRVVDGQQRLTTVSILLACIADKLGPDGEWGDWTAEMIKSDLLINKGKRTDKRRKLRLQDGDEEEYRKGLEGQPDGAGAVTQAWIITRRLVAEEEVSQLLNGLHRLRVVSIGLNRYDDPQQIFESLNATGRPLTESEKVKNWLLMGLTEEKQQELHDNQWRSIECSLGAKYMTEPIDIFFRDVLRWKTGKVQGKDHVYENFRRWAFREGLAGDRPAMCQELARLAKLYGVLTGEVEFTLPKKVGKKVAEKLERQLSYLRALGIDAHRPLTLRILNDLAGPDLNGSRLEELVKTLHIIATWVTRLWLAERPTSGLNTAAAELSHREGSITSDEYSAYWFDRIRRLRKSRVGVPSDSEVREGVLSRKAYGGSATRSSFAILYALMEAEKFGPPPAVLTIEHVMPRKLTRSWKRALGKNAEEVHGQYLNRLANLTLIDYNDNAALGAGPFRSKRRVYRDSSIGMTRRISEEMKWGLEEMERRGEDLATRVLNCWPWQDGESNGVPLFQWRIEKGPWHEQSSITKLLLDVAGTLLSLDPGNAERLSGEAISSNIHLAKHYPPGTKAGTLTVRAIPGNDKYVMHPYGRDRKKGADFCRKLGERCGVSVEVVVNEANSEQSFWHFLKDHKVDVPGQKDSWSDRVTQWTDAINSQGDRIAIYVGNPDRLWLFVRSGENQRSPKRDARMLEYSDKIKTMLADQDLTDDIEKASVQGQTIRIEKQWIREDESQWPAAADWLVDQYERLCKIFGSGQASSGDSA